MSACTPSEPPTAETPSPADTVVVAYSVDIRGVNELITAATPIHTGLHYYALFQPLLEEQADYQTGPPTFRPALAESWEFSDDRLQLTFHLRDGLVWSDGVPITAEDVRWTWQAQTDPAVGWPFAETKKRIADVEVVDPRTVRFHFREAFATQLLDANQGVILPKHAWQELPFAEWRDNGPWFVDHLVVSGPFTLESWEPQQSYTLRRNPSYYEEGFPRLERVVFKVVAEDSVQKAMLRSGEAHLIDTVQPQDVASLDAADGVDVLVYVPRQFNYLAWNCRRPLFASAEMRRALTLAIDRQEIVEALYFGHANVIPSPFSSNLWVYHPEVAPRPYDPAAAKELLAAEGWIDHDGDGLLDKDGEPLRFELLVVSSSTLHQNVLVMVQQQLQRLGIDAQVRPIEFNTKLSREMEGDFDATLVAAGIGTDLDLTYFFHSDPGLGSYNFGRCTDPQVDALLDEIRGQVDQAAAKDLYLELQERLHEAQLITVLYEPMRMIAVRENLRNVDPNALSIFFHLREWELRETP